ncbi:hypothetical protein N9X40_00640 [bacterium]|nr:hypothetical protein [bacterium]
MRVHEFFSLEEALRVQWDEWKEANPRRRRFNQTEKKGTKLRFTPDERMQTLGKCFDRDPNTRWNYYEAELFQGIDPDFEDCKTVEFFYVHRDFRDIDTQANEWKADLPGLLKEWSQQLDRANVFLVANERPFND